MTALPDICTCAEWFGPDDRPLLGWWTARPGASARTCVLVVPPVGYEYWSSHRTLRAVAEHLAGLGVPVLRMDYDGTGDSAGDQWEPDRVAAWRASVAHGVARLRDAGATAVILVGARLGATFALLDGAALGADSVVAWAPLVSGRRYGRELALLGTPLPVTHDADVGPGGGVVYAGSVFSRQTLNDLKQLDLKQIATAPAATVLVLDQEPGQYAGLVEQLQSLGSATDAEQALDSDHALRRAAEDAVVATEVVHAVSSWVTGRCLQHETATGPALVLTIPEPAARVLPWTNGHVREQVVQLGADRLVGIRGDSTGPDQQPGTTVVFVNSGSEPHVGPGRAWVEYSRALNLAGHRTLRLDYSGWGESPDLGHSPGRPYDPHTVEETRDVVGMLHEQGSRVVLVGLCAGAWVAMATARTTPVDGVFAINPQLYWQPGDPVEALISDTHERRTAERARDRLWARRGLWSALDIVGARHPVSRWLGELRRRGVPVLTVFSDGDDGLDFLQTRVGRAWRRSLRAGSTQLTEIRDIDHAMHHAWRRDDVVTALGTFVGSVAARV